MSNKSEITLHIELESINKELKMLDGIMSVNELNAEQYSYLYEKWFTIRAKGKYVAHQIEERL